MFGRKKTSKEHVRDATKGLKKEVRSIDRQRKHMEREEAKLIAEIRRKAKSGDTQTAKVLAKNLVRLRGTKTRLLKASGQLSTIKHSVTSMGAQMEVANSIVGATKAIQTVSKAMPLRQNVKAIYNFQRQMEKMNMTSDMVNEAFDNFDEEDEEETENVVESVLDEIGLRLEGEMVGAGSGNLEAKLVQMHAERRQDAKALRQ